MDGKGKSFTWQVRAEGPHFVRKSGFFELVSEKPGNLFTYNEPVRMIARLKNVTPGPERHTQGEALRYDQVRCLKKREELKFTPEKDGQEIANLITTARRGTFFLLEAEVVAGWEKRVRRRSASFSTCSP